MKRVWAFDTETFLIAPGLNAPPMVCLTYAEARIDDEGRTRFRIGPAIRHADDPETLTLIEAALDDADCTLVGHNVAYDLGVIVAKWPHLLPRIFAAYDEDRITDTMIRGKLFDIASGKYRGYPDERGVWHHVDYSLDSSARRWAGMALKKDGWRLRYREFADIPIDQWEERAAELIRQARETLATGVVDKDLTAIVEGEPSDVIEYPLNDARATLAVYLAQEETRKACDADPFADEFRQTRGDWWKKLMTTWGVRARAEGVEALRKQASEVVQRLTEGLVKAGLVRADGSRNMKAATQRMLDVCGWREVEKGKYEKTRPDARPLRKTAGGGVSLDRDACKESDDPILIDYGDRAQMQAVLDKDVPMLEAACTLPVHPRIDMAASGRSTMSGPNLQNLRRLPGIREAIVPRSA